MTYPKLESLGLEAGSYKQGEWDEGEMVECTWFDKDGKTVNVVRERSKSPAMRSIAVSEEWP